MDSDLTVEVSQGVAVLILNRPEWLNAYSNAMRSPLGEAYRACVSDDAVRAVVLTGAGSAFCTGADFSSGDQSFASRRDDQEFSASPIRPAAFEIRKPLIVAVNGHAIGIGLTIALQVHIRVFAEDARCGAVHVRRGVIPDCMSHWTMPHLAGLAVAADLLLTGRTFFGREATGLGLATSAALADSVLPRATAIAADIAENVAPSPRSRRTSRLPLAAALDRELLSERTDCRAGTGDTGFATKVGDPEVGEVA